MTRGCAECGGWRHSKKLQVCTRWYLVYVREKHQIQAIPQDDFVIRNFLKADWIHIRQGTPSISHILPLSTQQPQAPPNYYRLAQPKSTRPSSTTAQLANQTRDPSQKMSTTTNPDPSHSAPAFIPLEANPELMTALLRKLGLSSALQVHDVYSITEPELLAFIPRPALALLLVFPVSATYESSRLAEDAGVDEYAGKGPEEPVMWWKQTIRNACGLMGLLHAVSNGPAKGFIGMSIYPPIYLSIYLSLPFP